MSPPMTAEARARILAATGPAARHLSPAARRAVDWLADQDDTIVEGAVELVSIARSLAPEPAPRPATVRARRTLPLPRRAPTDTAGNSGP
jgi:hypothetical protein